MMAVFLIYLSFTYQAETQSIACNDVCYSCFGDDQCKDGNLRCRTGDSCEINCFGDDSCGGNAIMDGADSTDFAINCFGENSCKGNTFINCGRTSSCDLLCAMSSSCQDVRINTRDTLQFQCNGECQNIPSPFSFPTHAPTSPTNDPTTNPSETPSNHPSISPTLEPTFDPTQDPTIIVTTPGSTIFPRNSSETSTAIPLITQPVNSPAAIAIIVLLSVGIFCIISAITFLLIKKGKHGKFRIRRNPKLKHTDLKRSLSSNYGAVGIAKSNPLSLLREANEDTSVSAKSREKRAHEDSIELQLSLDQKLDEVPSTDQNVYQDMRQERKLRRSQFAKNKSDALSEYSNISVSSNVMIMLKERGDLCSSSDSFMHADDDSSSVSCLSTSSTSQTEQNLETGNIAVEGSDDEDDIKDVEIARDQWLVDEVNTLASPATLNTSVLSDGEIDDSDYIE